MDFRNNKNKKESHGDGRLGEWWLALQHNQVRADTIDEYAASVDGFLKFLIKRASS